MTTKMKALLVAGAMGILMTPQAQARDLGAIFQECGIGAAIFKDNGTAAALSNIIWDLGTTATSSDISSPESCKGGNAQVAMLIGKSYDKLETEIAEGQGKYLNTLATLSGKSVSEIRTKFSKVVASNDYKNMTKMEKAQKLFDITSL
jgi:hypothetical protein